MSFTGNTAASGAAQNASSAELAAQPGFVASEFIYEEAPFPECHASTIEETEDGLVAAWFGGTEESHTDVGIWVSRLENGEWSAPVEVADGVQHDTKEYPCWNPVLFQPDAGPLMLFYKVGPSPEEWWGVLRTSDDGGRSWSRACRLPEDILGPIKNKPIQLSNGDIYSPSSTEHEGWRVHFERTPDLARSWELVGPVNTGERFGVIQPTLLIHQDGRLQALCRSRQGVIVEIWSDDFGASWGPLRATDLPNPNSGIDGVTLDDGRQLLVYNHTTVPEGRWGGPRSPLNVAVSEDGQSWSAALVLENQPGEYSYPAVIQSSDGLVHVTYTWKRQRIKHSVINPRELRLTKIVDGEWPK